jgi:hypothetical protein
MKPINALFGTMAAIFLGACGVGAYAISKQKKRQTIRNQNFEVSAENGVITVTHMSMDGKGPDAEMRKRVEDAFGQSLNWRVCPECGEEKFSYDPEALCHNCK